MLEGVVPKHHGGRYEYWHPSGVQFVADWLHPTSRGLEAWVEVRWHGIGARLLHASRYDLMGSRTSSTLVSLCSKVMPAEKFPWEPFITACLYDVVSDHLEGGEIGQLLDAQASNRPKYLIKPLVGQSGATSIVAPGGSQKSFLALACGLQVATGATRFLQLATYETGPVLYLDWEADAETHKERMLALCKARDIPAPKNMWYRNESVALYRSANALEKAVAREGIVLVIVDSVMLARGSDAWGPEGTTMLYSALRQLGVPALLVDHKAKEAIKKGETGPYGSVVNENSARLMWEITHAYERTPAVTELKMEQTKRNNAPKMAPLAFRFDFDNEDDEKLRGVTVTQINPLSVIAMPAGKTLPEGIMEFLHMAGEEGATPQLIATALETTDNSVRARLSELERQGEVTKRDSRWYAAGRDEQRKALPDPM